MNEDKIKDLLNAGYSIAAVSEELDIPKKKLYTIAKKYNLPYNAPIQDGAPKEKRILRLSKQGFSTKDIGRIFKLSPTIIQRIIKKNEEVK